VRSGKQGLPGGLEMRARRRADVHEVRPRFREQGGDAGVGPGSRKASEGLSRVPPYVVYPDDGVRRGDAPQRTEMVAGHGTGANEGDSQRW